MSHEIGIKRAHSGLLQRTYFSACVVSLALGDVLVKVGWSRRRDPLSALSALHTSQMLFLGLATAACGTSMSLGLVGLKLKT